MGFTDIFKGKQYKSELEDLQAKYNALQSLMTPEMRDAHNLQIKIKELQSAAAEHEDILQKLDKDVAKRERTISDLDKTISDKKSKIIWMDDEILVQEFGLYKPQYDFANSLDYKERLAKVRDQQKTLIKEKRAVNGNTSWQVNGSASKGKKMVSDTQKLLLRAFNTECDDIISKVKYTNFDASLDRF